MVKVLVTGASGFIAQHLVKTLLEKEYQVVGTVRSEEKGNALKDFFQTGFEYEVVKDMTEAGSFDQALTNHKDIKYLFHTASPFFYDTTEPEKDLVIPAIKGTENILQSIKKCGEQVEKVIITSSDAAIYSSDDEQNGELSFDETSWNNISYEDAIKDSIAAYYGAKSFAEKLAWDFVKKENPNFKLAAVNPVYVFGPQVDPKNAKGKLNTSNELISGLLQLKEDNFDVDKGGYVDVRDVAKAHVAAVENDDATGKRLFLTGGKFSTQMMLDIINKHFSQLNLPKGKPGNGPNEISTLAKTNNDATKKILGFELNSLENVVVDTVSQILN